MQWGLDTSVGLVASFAMEKQNMGGAHKKWMNKCHHENMTVLVHEHVTSQFVIFKYRCDQIAAKRI